MLTVDEKDPFALPFSTYLQYLCDVWIGWGGPWSTWLKWRGLPPRPPGGPLVFQA